MGGKARREAPAHPGHDGADGSDSSARPRRKATKRLLRHPPRKKAMTRGEYSARARWEALSPEEQQRRLEARARRKAENEERRRQRDPAYRAEQERIERQRAHLKEHGPHGMQGRVPRGERHLSFDIKLDTIECGEDMCGVVNILEFLFPLAVVSFRQGYPRVAAAPTTEWAMWHADMEYEEVGTREWIGFSPAVPTSFVDELEEALHIFGPTKRSTRHWVSWQFEAILWMGEMGLEQLRIL